jgi:hypothetical protein
MPLRQNFVHEYGRHENFCVIKCGKVNTLVYECNDNERVLLTTVATNILFVYDLIFGIADFFVSNNNNMC